MLLRKEVNPRFRNVRDHDEVSTAKKYRGRSAPPSLRHSQRRWGPCLVGRRRHVGEMVERISTRSRSTPGGTPRFGGVTTDLLLQDEENPRFRRAGGDYGIAISTAKQGRRQPLRTWLMLGLMFSSGARSRWPSSCCHLPDLTAKGLFHRCRTGPRVLASS